MIYRESTREVYMDWYDPVLFIGQSGRLFAIQLDEKEHEPI
ncbi:hypothetical protein B4123_2278 [Bacillus paralicheniformis]|nr:hypothetical protein B4123_2278 [Bacillus paralicheniformis]